MGLSAKLFFDTFDAEVRIDKNDPIKTNKMVACSLITLSTINYAKDIR